MQMVDVECNIIESNRSSGVDGRTLRCIVENVSDGFTEVDESKQDIYLPVELDEPNERTERNLMKNLSKKQIFSKLMRNLVTFSQNGQT